MSEKKHIVIVGAGVIGLSTALAISENLTIPHKLTIIASHFPDDKKLSPEYTSPWAGAHYRPEPARNEAQRREARMKRVTHDYFKKLAESNPESSVKFVNGIEYFDEPSQDYINCSGGYTDGVEDFKVLPDHALPPGVALGTSYTTWVLNAPLYIQFLQRKLKMQYNVTFVKARINSLKHLFQKIGDCSVLINCSGKGLQYYGGYDHKSYSARGQTLLIRPPPDCPLKSTITHQLADGEWTYCIPRPLYGGVIVGGTKQVDDSKTQPREKDSIDIIKRARELFPELMKTKGRGEKYFDVEKVNVGLRPARKGGFKLEIENHGDSVIIHAYGAGGMGYELSYGAGMKVYELLSQLLARTRL